MPLDASIRSLFFCPTGICTKMPFKRRFKRKRRRRPRRRFRRRSRKSGLNTLVNRTVSVFPDRYRTKQRYCRFATINIATLTNVQFFSGNDIFAIEGGSEQPMGYDELLELYSRWCVTAASIKVRLVSNTTSSIAIVVVPTKELVAIDTFEKALSQPYAKSVIVGDNGRSNRTISHYIKTEALMGRKPIAELDYCGQVAASPNIEWTYQLFFQSIDSNTALNYQVVVEVMYYVTWFERIALDVS